MKKKILSYYNIEYVMPFLFCNDLYLKIFQELLKDDINPITQVFGSINSLWSGGRFSNFTIKNLNKVENVLQNIRKMQIYPSFTFTNRILTDEVLMDKFCNELLDIAYSNNSFFIVSSEKLYNHIKSRYPEAKMVSSVIMPILKTFEPNFDETKFYNSMLDKYDIVVVRPEYAIENIKSIDKLITDISRIEVLLNQDCAYNCNYAKTHYDLVDKIEIDRTAYSSLNKKMKKNCPLNKGKCKTTYLTKEMFNELIERGVKKYKIQGRDYSFNKLYDDLYYFVFNNEFSKEEIKNSINNITAEIMYRNKELQLMSILK